MVEIDERNLKAGLLGLVVGLVEIIQEVLEIQAIRRIESGRLSEDEIERLGLALKDMKESLDKIKEENDLSEIVNKFRKGLDDIVDEVADTLINPEKWGTQTKEERTLRKVA